MTTKAHTISKVAAAVGVAALVALGSVTTSLASNSNDGGPFVYEPSVNGSVWSYYPDYTASASVRGPVARAAGHRARTQISHPRRRSH